MGGPPGLFSPPLLLGAALLALAVVVLGGYRCQTIVRRPAMWVFPVGVWAVLVLLGGAILTRVGGVGAAAGALVGVALGTLISLLQVELLGPPDRPQALGLLKYGAALASLCLVAFAWELSAPCGGAGVCLRAVVVSPLTVLAMSEGVQGVAALLLRPQFGP